MAPPEARPPRPAGGIGAAVAAATSRARRSVLRNHGGGHAPVSNLELFFDLGFVFAITQLSKTLHLELSWLGLAQSVVLFLAVWWAWIFTAWVTNWANPDSGPVRILLLVLMLVSLAMAEALPRAFAGRGGAAAFAGCYCAIQLGRSLAMVAFFRHEAAARMRNMARIAIWFGFALPLWIGGVLADDHARLGWWLAALAIEYAGPMAMFRVPGLGASSGSDWDISGSHIAERCALFIIIALGEGIVVTGTAFAVLPLNAARLGSFATAFVCAALLWWLYFDMGAERGARMISGHSQAGRVARSAYTYLHMPIVLGIVIGAVGDALLIEAPGAPASHALVWVQTGGGLLFLGGLGLFKRIANTLGNFPMSHMIAVILMLALGLWGWRGAPPAGLFALAFAGVLLIACVWEWVSYHGGWAERMERIGIPYPRWMKVRADRRRRQVAARQGRL